ncbi:hypothetical protein EBQ81_00855 [bacterium]|nr:hypothetical protein [bacterium]
MTTFANLTHKQAAEALLQRLGVSGEETWKVLQLISDALEIIEPSEASDYNLAMRLSNSFWSWANDIRDDLVDEVDEDRLGFFETEG